MSGKRSVLNQKHSSRDTGVVSRRLLRALFGVRAPHVNGFLLMFIAAASCAFSAQGTVYYVSATGCDDATGESPQAAWASLARVNEAVLQTGDSVLFERGGQWRGQLVPVSGSAEGHVTYGAYGEGPKPLLLGSIAKNDPDDWVEMGANIWATRDIEPHGAEQIADGTFREAISSWRVYTENGAVVQASRDTSVFDAAPASLRLHCVQGATRHSHVQLFTSGISIARQRLYQVAFRARSSEPIDVPPPTLMERTAPWGSYGRMTPGTSAAVGADWSEHRFWCVATDTTSDARLTFFLGDSLPAGATLWLDFVSFAECPPDFFANDVGNIIFDREAAVGVKVWNREDLTEQGDFWFDKDTWRLYLYSVANPAERYANLECAVNRHIINQSNRHYIIYENLALKYGAAHGVGGGNTHNIIVRDCEFSYIGGGELPYQGRIVRFGNAVEFWGNARDNLVEGCRIWEIYDTGLTNQSNGPNTRQHNIRYRNNVVWNCEWLYEYWHHPETSSTDAIYIENNILAFAGHGWGHAQREDPHGRVIGMRRTTAPVGKVFIRNNIFFESTRYLLDMHGWEPHEIAGVTLENNSWYQSEGTAFLFGDERYGVSEFEAYQAESGQDANSIWADPLFVDAANGDFRLRDESPCRAAGIGLEQWEPAVPSRHH